MVKIINMDKDSFVEIIFKYQRGFELYFKYEKKKSTNLYMGKSI